MRRHNFLAYCISILLVAALAGCGSSKPPADNPSSQPSLTGADQPPKVDQKPPNKVDTVDVSMQNAKKPEYQPQQTTTSSTPTTGSYTVQVGAYKMQDNAERIASLAKDRFNRGINVVYDTPTGLYKVMVGSFITKDDARQFRDQMVQQFPADYKDAWVSDLTQK
jgi:cell division protein FtsN